MWQVVIATESSEDEAEKLRSLQARIVDCCQRVWTVVRYVLCDDSPEGHLPQELEEIDGLDTKDLLSYSFRAVHESRYVMSGSFLL